MYELRCAVYVKYTLDIQELIWINNLPVSFYFFQWVNQEIYSYICGSHYIFISDELN